MTTGLSNFKIPAKFDDKEFLNKINVLNERYKTGKITCTYGCLPMSTIGNALPSAGLPYVDLSNLEKYILVSEQYGIKFNYVMNAIWHNKVELSEDGIGDIYNEIKTLTDIGIKSITVASPFLATFIYNNFPQIEMEISINMNTSSLREISRWSELAVKRVVLTRHLNRDFKLLRKIVKNSEAKIELLANTNCNIYCTMHQYHNLINCTASYITNNEYKGDPDFPLIKCIYNALNNLKEMICAPWIRPEDVKYYKQIGICDFKLDGRPGKSEMILKNAEFYLAEKCNGNFFEVTNFFTEKYNNNNLLLFLDNRMLDGFIDLFFQEKINCRECDGTLEYCNSYAKHIIADNERLKNIMTKMLKNKINAIGVHS